MSTQGNVTQSIELHGRISMPDTIRGKSAYEIAVMNGFEGSEAEWLASLKGEKGDAGTGARRTYVTLRADAWQGEGRKYWQEVEVKTVTKNSKVELVFTDEQIGIFEEKDLWFTTTNKNGVVTVTVTGQKPQNDYVVQAELMEVYFVD